MTAVERGRADGVFPAGRPGFRSVELLLSGGERVRVVELGRADAPPVLLLHGWGCSAFTWREAMPALAAAGWRAVAPELRGHGQSDKPDDAAAYTTSAMTEQLIEIMDLMVIDRAAVVGHSLGGELAVELAMRLPDRVTHLALVAPVGFGRVWLVPLGRFLTPRFLTRLLPRRLGRWMFRLILRAATGRRERWADDVVHEYWAPSRDAGYARAARHMLHGFRWVPRSADELARIGIPTLIVVGTRDRLVLNGGVRALAARLPNATLEVLEGVGHVVAEEAPEQFNALLIAFLARRRAMPVPARAS